MSHSEEQKSLEIIPAEKGIRVTGHHLSNICPTEASTMKWEMQGNNRRKSEKCYVGKLQYL